MIIFLSNSCIAHVLSAGIYVNFYYFCYFFPSFQDDIVCKHLVIFIHVRTEVCVASHPTDTCARVLEDLVGLIAVAVSYHVKTNHVSMGFVLRTEQKEMVTDANVTYGG